ncbi:MAG: hypothetical protein PUB07_01765 [Clostridia bacterium]|nr:hypothetical protein [Clostridia bacterium]
MVLNKSVFAGVVRYVKNGALTITGIQTILDAFATLRPYMTGCDESIVFATASLRGLVNAKEVLQIIQEQTGVSVRLLSEEEEAWYDYLGLCSAKSLSAGIGGDLGGGSMQLYTFAAGGVTAQTSLPLGSMRLKCDFIHGALPTKKEAAALSAYVTERLSAWPAFRNVGHSTLYLTGGSIRAITMLWGKAGQISAEEIQKATETLSFDVLEAAFQNRAETIPAALLTIAAVLQYTSCTEVEAVMCGVREGILAEITGR